MKPRVYIDTSVVGGYFDEEFTEITKKFFERVFAGDFLIFFSDLRLGYPTIDIRSPLEFTGNEDNN